MKEEGVGGFIKGIGVSLLSLGTINPCNHDYPGMGWGLAHSLFALVWGTSRLYKGTRYPRIQVVLRKEETHITAYPEPPEDTMGLPLWH
jgi:hypothetical protein